MWGRPHGRALPAPRLPVPVWLQLGVQEAVTQCCAVPAVTTAPPPSPFALPTTAVTALPLVGPEPSEPTHKHGDVGPKQGAGIELGLGWQRLHSVSHPLAALLQAAPKWAPQQRGGNGTELLALGSPFTLDMRVPAAVSVSNVLSSGYLLITWRSTRSVSPRHSWACGRWDSLGSAGEKAALCTPHPWYRAHPCHGAGTPSRHFFLSSEFFL